MIFINEWFPNPTGADAKGEFIELYNSGSSDVPLAGYTLSTGKKKLSLKGHIPANGYLVLKTSATKLALKNTDGALWLYGPGGRILDSAKFPGSAPDGKSFSRVDYGTAPTQHFMFVDPTPGARNKTANTQIAVRHYPPGIPLNPSAGILEFFGLMSGVAIALPLLLIYVIQNNEALSKLFFRGDQAIGE